MLNPGIVASQISGHLLPTSGFVSLATTTVGSGGASSITFSAIPNIYTHLQIRSIQKESSGSGTPSSGMQFNGDTGSNYSYHALYGTGAGSGGGAAIASTTQAYIGNSSTTANIFANNIVDILDYSNTNKYKTLRSLSGVDYNGSGFVALTSSLWSNTATINSITILPYISFAQYSIFALYGVK
jgi:hypothetical protein